MCSLVDFSILALLFDHHHYINLLSFSTNLPVLDILYKWVHKNIWPLVSGYFYLILFSKFTNGLAWSRSSFYLFIWEAETEKESELIPIPGSLLQFPQWPGLGQAEAGNFIQDCHGGGRNPASCTITTTHPTSWPTLRRIWNQKLELGIEYSCYAIGHRHSSQTLASLHPFLWLNNIPWHDIPYFAYSFINWWVWALFLTFWLLWIKLLYEQ